jgi:hypothetical protein
MTTAELATKHGIHQTMGGGMEEAGDGSGGTESTWQQCSCGNRSKRSSFGQRSAWWAAFVPFGRPFEGGDVEHRRISRLVHPARSIVLAHIRMSWSRNASSVIVSGTSGEAFSDRAKPRPSREGMIQESLHIFSMACDLFFKVTSEAFADRRQLEGEAFADQVALGVRDLPTRGCRRMVSVACNRSVKSRRV